MTDEHTLEITHAKLKDIRDIIYGSSRVKPVYIRDMIADGHFLSCEFQRSPNTRDVKNVPEMKIIFDSEESKTMFMMKYL